ncbi:sensor histidine kinase [Marinagarivorans algicola]|uniref:sensor histidine kinase n=1 Tax=Marinagarivorans algicola TaxID=1513270 RepID=UPI000A75DE25|nr:HAMP domain-containing sensor histidine kinase [Marinagarivorans algicola]
MKPNEIDFATVLASSVHDMKNSVSMLIASLQSVLVDMPLANARQAEQINSLHYEASRINNELVQLLSIYRMQQERLPMSIDQHFVIDILEDQVARNYPLIESRKVSVCVDCDSNLEAYFDADLVGSVIQNVLVNGCRYTKGRLLLRATLADGAVCISVADDGDGFPQGMLDYPLRHRRGLGHSDSTQLGLYFASVIAQMHTEGERSGSIVLRNGEPLGGGVFEFYLPN